MLAIHACWIINGSGWTKRKITVRDLLKPERKELEFQTSEETKGFIEDAYDLCKRKFWAKIPDKYAKK